MTDTKKLALIGALALLAGVATMLALHQFGMRAGSGPWSHPMMHAPGGIGWAMALGPVAMALWFGGILTLVVALVRSVAKSA